MAPNTIFCLLFDSGIANRLCSILICSMWFGKAVLVIHIRCGKRTIYRTNARFWRCSTSAIGTDTIDQPSTTYAGIKDAVTTLKPDINCNCPEVLGASSHPLVTKISMISRHRPEPSIRSGDFYDPRTDDQSLLLKYSFTDVTETLKRRYTC